MPSLADELRSACNTAIRELPPASGGMSYRSSEWRAIARGMVCVKTRKGGRKIGVEDDVKTEVGCRSWRRPRSLPCSVAA